MVCTYFNKFHELLMRDVTTLEVHLHGQKESEEELVALIEASTGIPPYSQGKEADDIANPYLGIVTSVSSVIPSNSLRI